jgi:broad specificity phosphatase PhoE
VAADDASREPAPAAAPDAAERHGAVILARHGKPDLSRKVRINAAGYRQWWATYETVGLVPDQTPPARLRLITDKAGFIVASTRPRSVETAKLLCRGRDFVEDPLLVEAPLPPPSLPGWIKLSPRVWGLIARTRWWMLDGHDGQESRAEAHARADAVAAQLVALAAGGQDVLVVAHGFFNAMIARALRRQGWRRTDGRGYHYWSARRYERD